MHTPSTRGLRIPDVAELVEDGFEHLDGDPAGIGEVGARLWIEIHP